MSFWWMSAAMADDVCTPVLGATPQRLHPSAAAQLRYVHLPLAHAQVVVWDLDETLIIFNSLLNRTFEPVSDPSTGRHAASSLLHPPRRDPTLATCSQAADAHSLGRRTTVSTSFLDAAAQQAAVQEEREHLAQACDWPGPPTPCGSFWLMAPTASFRAAGPRAVRRVCGRLTQCSRS